MPQLLVKENVIRKRKAVLALIALAHSLAWSTADLNLSVFASPPDSPQSI